MRKVVISGMIGNGLEWYDYALYGHMAAIISKLFFPSDDPFTSLIATFGVFAAGFAMRPIGAILFGYVGDRYGRKTSLAFSILLMAIPTAAIGLLPTYAQIGIWAPILLTVIRLLQGLSLGGEFSGSITFMVEHAPPDKRGIIGSAAVVSLVAGMLLGSLMATIFAKALSPEDFESWGWRVPFLLASSSVWWDSISATIPTKARISNMPKTTGTYRKAPCVNPSATIGNPCCWPSAFI